MSAPPAPRDGAAAGHGRLVTTALVLLTGLAAGFLSGLFALGVLTIPHDKLNERHAWAAEGLAQTCWVTYADSVTGLGPERVKFANAYPGQRWAKALDAWERNGRGGGMEAPPGVREVKVERQQWRQEYSVSDGRYMLRPEVSLASGLAFVLMKLNDKQAIESFYLMWRLTGDVKWRERGWSVFVALERHARVGDAYASIKDVHKTPVTHENDMPRCVQSPSHPTSSQESFLRVTASYSLRRTYQCHDYYTSSAKLATGSNTPTSSSRTTTPCL